MSCQASCHSFRSESRAIAASSDTGIYIVVPPENCTAAPFMARRSALDHEHRRDVAERLALEHLPAEESAGIKAQIAPKEEEIDQLRQAVAGLREKAGRARGRRKRAEPVRINIPKTEKPKYWETRTGEDRYQTEQARTRLSVATGTAATLRHVRHHRSKRKAMPSTDWIPRYQNR